MSTATQDTITTIRSGSLEARVFCSVAVLLLAWYFFFQDWTPLTSKVRLQSPITFVSDQQPSLSLASISSGVRPDTVRIQTNAAQFDLRTVAKAENIELSDDDIRDDDPRQQYIRRFGSVAVAEMKQFGIPASITIAQGLLETRAGQSGLALKANNHFGMKCFSRSCKKGHCLNFSDDTHKDFFVKYSSAWASFRAHSKLLRTPRYSKIQGDYRAWAYGLKKCGYATAPDYAESLIRLIRLYGLDRLDNI